MAESAKKGVLLPVILDRKYARSNENCDVESLDISNHAIHESVRANNSGGYFASARTSDRNAFIDSALFAGADSLGVLMASLLSSLVAGALGGAFGFEAWMFVQIPIWWLLGISQQLYPGWGLSPTAEFKKVAHVTAAVYGTTFLYSFFGAAADTISSGFAVLCIGFVLCTALVYSLRTALSSRLDSKGHGGHATVIYGASETGRRVARSIASDVRSGLHPVAFLDDDPGKWGQTIDGIPVLGDTNIVVPEATAAIIALPRSSTDNLRALLSGPLSYYHHVTVIPEHHEISARKIQSLDGGSYFGIDIRKNPVHPDHQGSKRAFDITVMLLLSPLWLVASLLLGVLGFAESRELPVRSFEYLTERRCSITMHKFRLSMHTQSLLKRFGLEQLIFLPSAVNLLNGSISIIGSTKWQHATPAATTRGGSSGRVIDEPPVAFARPGLIGLTAITQIFPSIRTEEEQVEFYARNWSISLDILMLGRSFLRLLTP